MGAAVKAGRTTWGFDSLITRRLRTKPGKRPDPRRMILEHIDALAAGTTGEPLNAFELHLILAVLRAAWLPKRELRARAKRNRRERLAWWVQEHAKQLKAGGDRAPATSAKKAVAQQLGKEVGTLVQDIKQLGLRRGQRGRPKVKAP